MISCLWSSWMWTMTLCGLCGLYGLYSLSLSFLAPFRNSWFSIFGDFDHNHCPQIPSDHSFVQFVAPFGFDHDQMDSHHYRNCYHPIPPKNQMPCSAFVSCSE